MPDKVEYLTELMVHGTAIKVTATLGGGSTVSGFQL